MEQFEFHPFGIHPKTGEIRQWKSLEPGITQMTLNLDPSTGRGTYLQRWEPRTENQIQNFVHDYIEEIFIIDGDFRDLKGRKSGSGDIDEEKAGKGGDVWTKGCYAYRKPGMEHGPFRSETGCLMFIVCIPEKREDGIREASGSTATAL